MSELPYKIINGDSLKVLDTLEPNSIDSIITDPPYELGFMGKSWDKSGIAYNVELWEKALRVLKPGGYLLAFGGTRTFHRIACAIEDAGFEIRDTIMWLYGSGFPKSMNIGLAIDKKNGVESEVIGKGRCGKNRLMGGLRNETHDTSFEIKQAQNEWQGWGTALKPSYEPVIVARKPIEGTVAKNCLKYGVGGINIDECRVKTDGEKLTRNLYSNPSWKNSSINGQGSINDVADKLGRFPANTILTYDESDYDEVCGGMPDTNGGSKIITNKEVNRKGLTSENPVFNPNNCGFKTNIKNDSISSYGDNGSASRYFYNAKASKKDRDDGMLLFNEKKTTDGCIRSNSETARIFGANSALRKNIHPTVKPSELMQYLVRLVTPKNGTVLDIFNGSGSTGKACMFENRERNANYKYIGIELDPEYCKISEARIDYALNKFQYDVLEAIKENEEKGQLSLFSDYND